MANGQAAAGRTPVLVVHGGAGTISPVDMTPAREAAYRQALRTALMAGQDVLLRGQSSVEAVIAAVKCMEDDPLFNAGKGAVLTSDGRHELDACVMDGKLRKAGAVAGLTRVKNPVVAAHAVMLHSGHVFLAGAGADQFAAEQGLELVDPSYFSTAERVRQLERAKSKQAKNPQPTEQAPEADALDAPTKYGTVGAVALDVHGNLAAATSTGGLTNKRYGRVGDSPIVGAGTYADNRAAAVSATGAGEAFMRCVAAHEVTALMRYKGLTLAQAIDEVAMVAVPACDGRGGLIGIDADGNAAMSFSTDGMYRGIVRGAGEAEVAIYR